MAAREGRGALARDPNAGGREQQAGREFLSDGMSGSREKRNAASKGAGLYP